jgi:ribosome-associated heat shock protein Hsp15
MADSVRVDKWLQVARMFKTRSLATRACTLNQVKVNGTTVKPHRNLQLGDRIEVEKGDWTRILVVKELHDKTLPKKEVPRLFDDQSPARPVLSKLDRLLLRAPAVRDKGAGAPSKKERRELRKLRGY